MDTEGVEPYYSPSEEAGLVCPVREDVREELPRGAILANAAQTVEEYFVTPPPNVPIQDQTVPEKKS